MYLSLRSLGDVNTQRLHLSSLHGLSWTPCSLPAPEDVLQHIWPWNLSPASYGLCSAGKRFSLETSLSSPVSVREHNSIQRGHTEFLNLGFVGQGSKGGICDHLGVESKKINDWIKQIRNRLTDIESKLAVTSGVRGVRKEKGSRGTSHCVNKWAARTHYTAQGKGQAFAITLKEV